MIFAQRIAHLALIAAALAPLPAYSHAILLDSDPAVLAQIPPGPVMFRLHYNSRIDHARSRLTLIAPDRSETRLAIADASAPDGLTTSIDATPGSWVIRWQVLALDGHITRGDVPFAVAAKP
jgi:methionine-rich copper-binding protein CopC